MIRIRKGLDLPIAGAPTQSIEDGPRAQRVALLGADYVGMRPTMRVRPGDRVKRGQLLFSDKKTEGVVYTSPGSGEVIATNRGPKRVFESMVIRLDGDDAETFSIDEASPQEALVQAGLWPALRTRPFSRVPAPDSRPHSIFVTAIDSNPLAPDPAAVLVGSEEDFAQGLGVLTRLTDGKVYLCKRAGAQIPTADGITVAEFDGPHPSGLPGTHIHFLDPVHEGKVVWYIGYQDVVAFGAFLRTKQLPVDRVVAIAGPAAKNPRLVRTRIGASTEDLTAGEIEGDEVRVISGSVLAGHTATDTTAFLGRYDNQISLLSDHVDRPFLGWLAPGFDAFSATGAFVGSLLGRDRKRAFNTGAAGEDRAIVPIGSYERVLPLDFEPTPLLKSLIVGDVETAMMLGCLELDEEDLSLCSYVCPGKSDFGGALRTVLTSIERDG